MQFRQCNAGGSRRQDVVEGLLACVQGIGKFGRFFCVLRSARQMSGSSGYGESPCSIAGPPRRHDEMSDLRACNQYASRQLSCLRPAFG